MEALRSMHRTTLLALVLLAALLAGCASVFDRDDDDYDDYDDYDTGERVTEVRGRVESIDDRDRIVWVEPSGVYRSDLRDRDEDRIALYYDSATIVEYEGRTYEPTALEPGDRIVADVYDDGSRLEAREIEVTYDVTGGDRYDDDDRSADDRYDDRYDDDRYDDDRYDDERYDQRDDARTAELRGRVRWLDQSRRILELEDASWGWGAGESDRYGRDDVVEIHYDTGTVVEFEGRRYQPANLERGDEVQIEVRDTGSRYVADEILVIASVRD